MIWAPPADHEALKEIEDAVVSPDGDSCCLSGNWPRAVEASARALLPVQPGDAFGLRVGDRCPDWYSCRKPQEKALMGF
jgi:hypothetical protein